MPHDLPATPLFSSLDPAALPALLRCIGARQVSNPRRARLLTAGDACADVGLIARGCVHVLRDDPQGNPVLLARLTQGDLLAESFACSGIAPTVSAQAEEDCLVWWLPAACLLAPCARGCAVHAALAANLTRILARRNVFLTGRIAHLSERSLRGKVLSYLADEAARQGTRSFRIPFDRQGLADYLAADRSALSAVLCRLRDEGRLTFRKNYFTLL